MSRAKVMALVLVLTGGSSASAQCEARLEASPPILASFLGAALAAEGDEVVVGAFGQGRVHVFERSTDGWAEVQVLAYGSGFGSSVDLDGDRLVVGDRYDGEVAPAAGAAWTFTRGASGWEFESKLLPPGGVSNGNFGASVAVEGDRLVVGELGDGGPGVVHVYDHDGTGWSQVVQLVGDQPGVGSGFGGSVDLAGSLVLVGGGFDAAVFEQVGPTWQEQVLSTGIVASVVASADRLVVGDSEGHGQVRIFRRGQGQPWGLVATLTASDGESGDRLGSSVAMDGDRIVAGASRAGGWQSRGAAYEFEKTGAGWTEIRKLVASDGGIEDFFGDAVAYGGSSVLIGAPNFNGAPGNNSGIVYAFDRECLDSFRSYGFCDAFAPCVNVDPLGGCANSTGTGALLATSPDSTASVERDDLVLRVTHLPAERFGLIYMGPQRANVPFGDGRRVVEPGPPGFGFLRFDVRDSGAAGELVEGPGLVAYSVEHFGAGGAILPGSTWHFQAYYRDPAGPCGSGFNLSNGLTVGFYQ